jgi:hypothetical protein
LGADLEVHLEARRARLEHHVVVRGLQLVDALDLALELAAAQLGQEPVHRQVARARRHVVEREVRFSSVGQDAAQHDLRALFARRGARALEQHVELVLHARRSSRRPSPAD